MCTMIMRGPLEKPMDESVWRPRLAKWSQFTLITVGLVCILIFLLMPLSNWVILGYYVLLLVLWFLLLTIGFHHVYFANGKITQAHVKLIDYFYIGFGALGFFMLIAGQHERDPYWNRFSQTLDETYYRLNRATLMVLPTTTEHPNSTSPKVPSSVEELKSYLKELYSFHCDEVGDPYKGASTEFCIFVSKVIKFLDSSNSNEVWATASADFRKFAVDKEVIGPKIPGGLSFISASLKGSVFSPEYQRAYWYKFELGREAEAILNSLERLGPKLS